MATVLSTTALNPSDKQLLAEETAGVFLASAAAQLDVARSRVAVLQARVDALRLACRQTKVTLLKSKGVDVPDGATIERVDDTLVVSTT